MFKRGEIIKIADKFYEVYSSDNSTNFIMLKDLKTNILLNAIVENGVIKFAS